MKKMMLIGLMITALLIALFSSCKSFAQTATATILFLQGEVKIQPSGSSEWRDAEKGMLLSSGDKIKTGALSWIEIALKEDNKNIVRVKESTLAELIEIGPAKVNLLNGELRALIEKLNKAETFEILTPTAVCGARGTGLDTNTDGKKVVVDVFEDSIYFASSSKSKEGSIINAGKRGIFEDPAKPIKIKNVPVEKMRDWSKWKEDFTERRNIETGKSDTGNEGQDTAANEGDNFRDKAENLIDREKSADDAAKGKENLFESDKQETNDNAGTSEKRRGIQYP